MDGGSVVETKLVVEVTVVGGKVDSVVGISYLSGVFVASNMVDVVADRGFDVVDTVAWSGVPWADTDRTCWSEPLESPGFVGSAVSFNLMLPCSELRTSIFSIVLSLLLIGSATRHSLPEHLIRLSAASVKALLFSKGFNIESTMYEVNLLEVLSLL